MSTLTPAQRPTLAPATSPTGSGAIGVVGPLLAILLIALGVLAGQDALAHLRGGTSWIAAATTGVDGLAPAAWLVVAGVVLALIGLWLVITTFRPRTRDTLRLAGAAGAHLRTVDVARLTSAAAADVDGVLAARSSATRRTVTVKVTTTGEAESAAQAKAAAEAALAPLVKAPRVRLRATSPTAREGS